jgi:hypothetical protein
VFDVSIAPKGNCAALFCYSYLKAALLMAESSKII